MVKNILARTSSARSSLDLLSTGSRLALDWLSTGDLTQWRRADVLMMGAREESESGVRARCFRVLVSGTMGPVRSVSGRSCGVVCARAVLAARQYELLACAAPAQAPRPPARISSLPASASGSKTAEARRCGLFDHAMRTHSFLALARQLAEASDLINQ